jgi:hypothetical protein
MTILGCHGKSLLGAIFQGMDGSTQVCKLTSRVSGKYNIATTAAAAKKIVGYHSPAKLLPIV